MVLNGKQAKELLTNPDKTAKLARLNHVSETDLCIERRRRGRGFQYLMDEQTIRDKEIISRIEKLVIPPAWKDVKICPTNDGHLQAVGRDDKQRKQYIYHPHWNHVRNQTKFFKMASFGRLLPKIRQQTEADLRLRGMPRRKVVALVIRLMEETHIRIGNESYARQNKSYGLSTLRSRHIKFSDGALKFQFVGKRGKEHTVSLRDKKLIKLVNQCEEIPGWEIFKYYEPDGTKNSLDSGMVNEYIQELCGEWYSAKDFRTWSGTTIFFEHLRGRGYVEDPKENEKAIIEAYDATASELGNTRAVCRKYYVHPMVVEQYHSGQIVEYFKKVERKRTNNPYISHTEEVLLEMLKEYELQIGESQSE